jgi:hypothetical protein
MIDVNDFMASMSNSQRHHCILKMHQGMFEPIFSYTWTRGGSRAGVYPHVIWRFPLKSEKQKRGEGLKYSQNNIDYLNQNATLYRTRAERAAYMATVVNTNFISSRAAAQVMYEFITINIMPKNSLSIEAIAAALL